MTVERNIQMVDGRLRVLVTRRPQNIFGGYFKDIEQARVARDRIEAEHPPKPRGGKPSGRHVRTEAERRHARLQMGLCQLCGQCPPKEGRRSCEDCLRVVRIKTAQRRAA